LTSTGNGIFTSESTAISTSSISNAITLNSRNRAELGALSNSISYAIDNLQTLSNNLSDAYSRIVDTDYASETANLTKSKILQQAAAAMLAQANQMPNVILSLLK
jgi:flagellin